MNRDEFIDYKSEQLMKMFYNLTKKEMSLYELKFQVQVCMYIGLNLIVNSVSMIDDEDKEKFLNKLFQEIKQACKGDDQ